MANLLAAPARKARPKVEPDRSSFWLGFLVLTSIAVGTGAFVAFQTAEMTRQSISDDQRPDRSALAFDLGYNANVRLRTLNPMVANLAAPSDAWIRVQASLVLADNVTGDLGVLTSHIEEDILAYLRTLTIGHIEGAVGLQHLREDLNERAKTRSSGQVHEVILESLVIQ